MLEPPRYLILTNKKWVKMRLHNVGLPFKQITIDIDDPFLLKDERNCYMMLVADYFTKWMVADAVKP